MSGTYRLGDFEFSSRLIIGTGKYKSFEENRAALDASGAEMITVEALNASIGGDLTQLSSSDCLLPVDLSEIADLKRVGGESYSCSFTTSVPTSAPGSITNTVTATFDDNDDPAGDNCGDMTTENSDLGALRNTVLDKYDRQQHGGQRQRSVLAGEGQAERHGDRVDGYAGHKRRRRFLQHRYQLIALVRRRGAVLKDPGQRGLAHFYPAADQLRVIDQEWGHAEARGIADAEVPFDGIIHFHGGARGARLCNVVGLVEAELPDHVTGKHLGGEWPCEIGAG